MKDKLLRRSAGAVVTLGLISCIGLSAFASPSTQLPHFEKDNALIITTDKTTYKADEDVKVNITFTNTSASKIENVLLKTALPNGLKEKNNKDLQVSTEYVESNGKLSLDFVLVENKNDDSKETTPTTPATPTTPTTITDNTKQQNTNTNNNMTTNTTQNNTNTAVTTTDSNGKTIVTGSSWSYVIGLSVVMAVAVIMIFALRKRKKNSSVLSLLLCTCILSATVLPAVSVSAESDTSAFYGFGQQKTITINSKDYTIEAEVKINCPDEVTPESPTDTPSVDGPYTLENIRNYVVGIDEPVELIDGTKKTLINFDNAATTPVLTPVMNAVNEELKMYGSIGRGFSQKSDHSTDVYNDTREKIKRFVGVPEEESYLYTCVYVDNTTDGLNKLASALIKSKDDIVLTTRIEHHSNDLSWRERCKVIYAEVDELGRVKYDDMERLLKENKVKYVSVTAASNVTGYVTDVHRVAKLAHKYGAKIIVDGAQIVAHRQFSMAGNTPDENIDLFVFSAHKMYTPYGGGAIVGLFDELNKGMPDAYGGGTIDIVGDDWENYKQAPASYEAGSPNYASVVGLSKAIDILQEVGFDKIQEHEKALNRRLIDGLKKLDNVIIYGDTENIDDRVGVVTFNFSDINSYLLAQRLKEYGAVASRRGAFCAHPYVWRLMGIPDEQVHEYEHCADIKTPGMVRISFGIYNTEEEVDQFLALMPEIMEKAKDTSGMIGEINPAF